MERILLISKKGNHMTEENKGLLLNEYQVSYIKYFVERYNKEFKEGNWNEAHHDATALVFFFDEILNHSSGEER